MTRILLLFCITALNACTAGKKTAGDEILSIRYGKGFGMCRGYCYEERLFTKEQVTVTRWSHHDTLSWPRVTEINRYTDEDWKMLKSSFNLDSFFLLPEVIGCPDCADQGAEWIEITTARRSHRVEFEFLVAPPGMEDFLARLRN